MFNLQVRLLALGRASSLSTEPFHRCNCYCCDSVNDRFCTYTCPTCYSAILDVSYKINGGEVVNTTYRHDSKKDRNGATRFIDQHRVGMKSRCFYNPRNVGEVCALAARLNYCRPSPPHLGSRYRLHLMSISRRGSGRSALSSAWFLCSWSYVTAALHV